MLYEMCMNTKTGNIIFRLWDGIFKEEKKEVKRIIKKKNEVKYILLKTPIGIYTVKAQERLSAT